MERARETCGAEPKQAFLLRPVQPQDYSEICRIYNSNRRFLRNHLGTEQVDENFAAEEAEIMKQAGFESRVIENPERRMLGVLDFRPGREVYLSLMMLAADAQGAGVGRAVYGQFEAQMARMGSETMRIDVVNEDPENTLMFWKQLGFSEDAEISLEWRGKTSRAVVMRKRIAADPNR